MKEIEYDIRMKDIKEEYENKKINLQREYAKQNNPYKIGEVISDHYQTIRIESMRIGITLGSIYPVLIYKGPKITKSGKFYKSGEVGEMWQSNINILKTNK